MAELSVFYCEESVAFLKNVSVDDEKYYDALVSMFEKALKAISLLTPEVRQDFLDRLYQVRLDSNDFGYGVMDDMGYFLEKYGFIHE